MSTTANIEINGHRIAAPTGAVAYKYADPIDDARWIYDETEARQLDTEGAPIVMVEA